MANLHRRIGSRQRGEALAEQAQSVAPWTTTNQYTSFFPPQPFPQLIQNFASLAQAIKVICEQGEGMVMTPSPSRPYTEGQFVVPETDRTAQNSDGWPGQMPPEQTKFSHFGRFLSIKNNPPAAAAVYTGTSSPSSNENQALQKRFTELIQSLNGQWDPEPGNPARFDDRAKGSMVQLTGAVQAVWQAKTIPQWTAAKARDVAGVVDPALPLEQLVRSVQVRPCGEGVPRHRPRFHARVPGATTSNGAPMPNPSKLVVIGPTPLPGFSPSDGATRPLPELWLGLSGTMKDGWAWEGLAGADPFLHAALKDMRVRVLRYPGGSVSRTWDPLTDTPTLSTFVAWCAQDNLHPVLVLRISDEVGPVGDTLGSLVPVADVPARAQALVSTLGVQAAQITHVEVGNEVYDDDQFSGVTPTTYLDAFLAWYAVLAPAMPQARFALSFARNGAEWKGNGWNLSLATAVQNVVSGGLLSAARLAVTVHPYYPALGGEGSGWGTAAEQAADWTDFVQNDGAARLIGAARRKIETIEGLAESLSAQVTAPWFGEVPLWITETNVIDNCGPTRLTWAAGLAHLAHLFAALRATLGGSPWVELVAPHGLTPGTAQGHQVMYGDQTPFGGLLAGTPPDWMRGKWSPAGFVIARLGLAIGNASSAVELAFTDEANQPPPTATVALIAEPAYVYPTLEGWRFPQPNGKSRYLLANFGPSTPRVFLPWAPGEEVLADHASPTAWIGRPGHITHTRLPISRSGVDLPPWSIAICELIPALE